MQHSSLASLFAIIYLCLVYKVFGQQTYWRPHEFESRVNAAIARTKDFLHDSKFPVFPTQSNHVYEDKYQLAEFLVGSAYEALVRSWKHFGVNDAILAEMHAWASENRTVHLRFSSETKCRHKEYHVYKVEVGSSGAVQHTEIRGGSVGSQKIDVDITTKNFRMINESVWNIDTSYSILVYPGSDEQIATSVFSSTLHSELTTSTHFPPSPPVTSALVDEEISTLLRAIVIINGDSARRTTAPFSINRTDPSCHTPRRNADVAAALTLASRLLDWFELVHRQLYHAITRFGGIDILGNLKAPVNSIFSPVLPVFFPSANRSQCLAGEAAAVGTASGSEGKSKCSIIATSEMLSAFLAEEEKSLVAAMHRAAQLVESGSGSGSTDGSESGGKAIAAQDVGLLVVVAHCQSIVHHLRGGIDFLEELLRAQLVAALGKTLRAADFDQLMEHHNQRVFAADYAPKPFTFSIRRGAAFSPEGLLSVESRRLGEAAALPINTISRQYLGASNQSSGSGSSSSSSVGDLSSVAQQALQGPPLLTTLPLSAGFSVSLGGTKHLHAWMMHVFSEGEFGSDYSVVAQARQFSSYILLIGRLVSIDHFNPEYAVIVRDKDVVRIPLDVSIIPSAQEFRDATKSLSPEQEEFAKAYRGMQLGHTLLAVAVVQIKPQLEVVLNLLPGSLTKEIKLTQDLMDLFVDYQIPSDLLSYCGAGNREERILAVKENVAAVKDMINTSKAEQIAAETQRMQFAKAKEPSSQPSMIPSGQPSVQPSAQPSSQPAGAAMHHFKAFSTMAAMETVTGSASSEGVGMAMPAPMMGEFSSPDLAAFAMPEEGTVLLASGDANFNEMDTVLGDQSESDYLRRENSPSSIDAKKLPMGGESVDFTLLPGELEGKFDGLGRGISVRPSVITPRSVGWTRTRHQSLLSPAVTEYLHDPAAIAGETSKALELLDALTRSGGLAIEHSTLHVIVANAHVFDKSLMDTVIQDNLNPIDKAEEAMLLCATVLHRESPSKMLTKAHQDRLTAKQKNFL